MWSSHSLLLPTSFAASSSSSSSRSLGPTAQGSRLRSLIRCASAGRGGRPRWDPLAQKTIPTQRFRFNHEDGPFGDDAEEEDDEFGFRRTARQRSWWSDDSLDADDEDEERFPVWEDSLVINWISKVFRSFSWMLPAVLISMLLGTGPDTFFMALALPLAQMALSLAVDIFWSGSSGRQRKAKPRTRKKPFTRAASNIGRHVEQEENIENHKGTGNYHSWAAEDDVATKKDQKSKQSFGGWDELDMQGGTSKAPKMPSAQKATMPRQQERGKLNRRVRRRDTPLLLRLLIAVFPFLGSWTKLL